jgi:outer membrane lipoprotein-sorting protein
MRPDKNIVNAMKSVRVNASARLDNRVHSGIDQALAESQQTLKVPFEPQRRSTFMKSPMMRIAAAAVIAVVATVGILMMAGGKPAFAKVIKPILNARTVVFDFIVGDEATSPVIHDQVVGSRIRRTFSNMPVILVLDLDGGKMLTLNTPDKTAVYVDIQGQLVEGTQSVLKLVRDIVGQIADHPNEVQDLGQRQIEGRSAVGFLVKGEHVTLDIWADIETAMPVRIELHTPQSTTILKDIQFDTAVDDSLVSMDVPAGYTQKKTDMNMGNLTEQDFVEGLRIWAQHLNGGTFPDAVSVEAAMQLMPALGAKINQLNLPADEGMKMGMAFGKGLGFLQILSHQGEWHYAGKGVTLGDAKTAVFWYRRGDAKTYRVIYGDLHVEDVELERMPK